jgi:hypothetical protein
MVGHADASGGKDMPIGRRLRRWALCIHYLMAEFQYVSYRGPHGYRFNAIAARRHDRWKAA